MHYLDHAATTPLRPSAREAWLNAAGEPGNPSSVHAAGRRSRAILEDAREQIAALLGAHPTEVILTSGATEANNLALASAEGGIVTTAIEHHSLLDPAKALGASFVGVRRDGVLDLDELEGALAREGAGLVSVQWVNNEVGTIQPIADVVARAADAGVPVHSDAVQAVGHLPVDFGASGLAMMAVSAHKVGGPVGVGALLARRDVRLSPLARGGGQQRGRSGTLDAAGAAAFAAALAEATSQLEAEANRLEALRADVADGIVAIDGARVMGGAAAHAPHIINIVLPGTRAEAVLFGLDQAGIEVSSGSACTAGVVDASHVLLAMGEGAATASAAIRVSAGWTTTREDVGALLGALPGVVAAARAIG